MNYRNHLRAALCVIISMNMLACEESTEPAAEEETFGDGKVATAIDLGLSVDWAEWNIGGEMPADFGLYFQWGATSTDSSYYDAIGEAIFGTEHDAAHVRWDDGWRMPTTDEIRELVNDANCTWEWTTQTNSHGSEVNGYLVTSKKEGYTQNSIFLPASGETGWSSKIGTTGFLWSGSAASIIDKDGTAVVYGIDFIEDYHVTSSYTREHRFPIRPVRERKAD